MEVWAYHTWEFYHKSALDRLDYPRLRQTTGSPQKVTLVNFTHSTPMDVPIQKFPDYVNAILRSVSLMSRGLLNQKPATLHTHITP